MNDIYALSRRIKHCGRYGTRPSNTSWTGSFHAVLCGHAHHPRRTSHAKFAKNAKMVMGKLSVLCDLCVKIPKSYRPKFDRFA